MTDPSTKTERSNGDPGRDSWAEKGAAGAPRADYAPEGTDTREGLWPTLKRTASIPKEDNMSDWAAALPTTASCRCSRP